MADELIKCYEILEISLDASFDEIKSHYRDLVSIWHPDRFADYPRRRKLAEEKTKQIIGAYQEIESYFKTYGKPRFSSSNNEQPKDSNDYSSEYSSSNNRGREDNYRAQDEARRKAERESSQGEKWKAWADNARQEDFRKEQKSSSEAGKQNDKSTKEKGYAGKCKPPTLAYRMVVFAILLVFLYIIGTIIEKKQLEQTTDISKVDEATNASANKSENDKSEEQEKNASIVSNQKFERVDIPKNIYPVLEKEEQFEPGRNGKVESDFIAEKCYLNNDEDPEIIIWKVGYSGASNMPVDIYAKTVDGYKRILETPLSAGGVSTKGSYTNSYKDIELYMSLSAYETGIHTFKYDGSKYREVDCVFESFIDKKTDSILKKPIYEKCEVQSESETNNKAEINMRPGINKLSKIKIDAINKNNSIVGDYEPAMIVAMYYSAIMENNINGAIRCFANNRTNTIDKNKLKNIMDDTGKMVINNIEEVKRIESEAVYIVKLNHEKKSGKQDHWILTVCTVKEDGIWKIDTMQGKKTT